MSTVRERGRERIPQSSLPKAGDVVKRKSSFWISNLLALVTILALLYGAFPRALSWILYQGVYAHFPYVLVVGIGGFICLLSLGVFADSRRRHLGVVYLILGLFVLGGGIIVQWSGASSVLAQMNTFAPRKVLIDDDRSHLRFTPFDVAFRGMQNTFSDSAFYLDRADMAALDVDGGFGYVVPTIPNGVLQPFFEQMNGFVIFNDDPSIPDNQRIRRVHQKFKYGLGMQWFVDIWLQLARDDPFAVYGRPYYEQLDPANRDKFTLVVPKMRYSFGLAAYLIPVSYRTWGGVALVHDTGVIESLSVEQAKSDPRLKGHMIYPHELADAIVEAQVYDEGIMSGWFQRPGKIEVPELPGNNQMPFLVKSVDGRSYDIVTAEPAGPSHSLYRVYAVDMSTGERSVFEYDSQQQGLIGPAAAISYGKSIPGINWIEDHDGKSSGNFQLVEPLPVTRGGTLYWKMTQTQRDYASVVGTVVVDPARPTEGVRRFDTRGDFFAWLDSNEPLRSNNAAPAMNNGGVDIQSLVRRTREQLKDAEQSLDALESAINKK